MTLSTAAKAGIGGTLATAGSGATATYLAWDHITLYAVEREVINNNILLSVKELTTQSSTITIEASKSTEETIEKGKLKKDHSWSCEISQVTSSESISVKNELNSKLSGLNKEQRIELVKACSKVKKSGSTPTNELVVGTLQVKTQENKFVFENHSNLDYLLKSDLFEVEREVINKDLKFSTPTNADNKITIKALSNSGSATDSDKLKVGNSWSCEVTVTPDSKGQNEASSIVEKLKNKLPVDNATNNKENKILLVKACSKDRKDEPSNTTVVGQLKVDASNSGGSTSYSFKNHPELKPLLS